MFKNKTIASLLIVTTVCLISFLIGLPPAQAHHAIGGRTPANFFEGLLSGLAHPVIGLDHFAFIVAIGLLGVLTHRLGIFIPIVFSIATTLGTVIHLYSIDLPGPEIIIALSVVGVGFALAINRQFDLRLLMLLGAIAGVFHGYAYGESIVGAEMNPLTAYLFGFTLIQITVSAIAFSLGKLVLNQVTNSSHLYFRFAGFTVCGIGLTFLSNALFT